MKIIKPVKLWTWAIKGYRDQMELCYFTYKTKAQLLQHRKPSPEAKPVRVLVTPILPKTKALK